MMRRQPRDETAKHPRLMKLVSQVKQQLLVHHPFIGSITMGFKYIVSSDMKMPGSGLPTLGVDGRNKRIYIHPDFVRMGEKDQRSFHEMMFAIAHECFHPMFEHHIRRGHRDPLLWNIAGDYVINHFLVEDKIGSPPKDFKICLDADVFREGEGVTERIYNNLKEEQMKRQASGGAGSGDGDGDGDGGGGGGGGDDDGDDPKPMDVVFEHDLTDAERAQEAAEWRVNVAAAAQNAKSCGKLSANAERIVEEMLEPRVPWEKELQDYTVKMLTDKRSWSRFNRRFVSQGMYMPGRDGDALGVVVFGADCSGSVSDREFGMCAGQVRYIKDEFDPEQMHMIYFDHGVCGHDVYERWDEFDPKPRGGGGTAFSPVFEYIEEHGIEPSLVIMLTDMYCDDFGPEPPYPVLWVSTSGADWNPPFGKVIAMDTSTSDPEGR